MVPYEEIKKDFEVGDLVSGVIQKIIPQEGLFIKLSNGKYGRVALTEISNHFEENPTKKFAVGKVAHCKVLHFEKEK